jgi:hypothetical protein
LADGSETRPQGSRIHADEHFSVLMTLNDVQPKPIASMAAWFVR